MRVPAVTVRLNELYTDASNRNSSSTLPDSKSPGGQLALGRFYPQWSVNTIDYRHRADEVQEFQLLHLIAARFVVGLVL